MSSTLTPTTELEAVNRMLFVIGESPINTLENSGLVDAVTARQILAQASREVQLVGWHWNSEEDYPLTQSYPSGEISVPSNTLKIDTSSNSASLDLVQRGIRLYDRKKHSYEIGQDITVNIVLYLPFEELPEAARNYITMKACRMFQANSVGSELLYKFSQIDESNAWLMLVQAEADTEDLNILTDNPTVVSGLNRDPSGVY